MNRATLHGVPDPYADLIRVRNLECAELRRQNAALRKEIERLTLGWPVSALRPVCLPSGPTPYTLHPSPPSAERAR
jgi:hypothetical protein